MKKYIIPQIQEMSAEPKKVFAGSLITGGNGNGRPAEMPSPRGSDWEDFEKEN